MLGREAPEGQGSDADWAEAAPRPRTPLGPSRQLGHAQMIGAGYDLRTVAGRLGHRQPWTTLNTYAAFLPERDHAAANHLASLLGDR